MKRTVDITCLRGAVRVRLEGEPAEQFYGHCDDCQATSGGAYVAAAVYPADAVTATRGELATRMLKTMPRRRCAVCGTHMLAKVAGVDLLGVKANLLPEGSSSLRSTSTAITRSFR